MKKLFSLMAVVLMTTFCFATTTPVKNEKEKTSTEKISKAEKSESKSLDSKDSHSEEFCSVSCSVTVHGVTHTFTAGNFLSSCEGAARRCQRKIERAGYADFQ